MGTFLEGEKLHSDIVLPKKARREGREKGP